MASSAVSPESPESVLLQLINVHITLGAFEVGVVLSAFLFGITSLQSYIYYGRFPKDPWHLKALVAFLWLIEFAHSILITTGVYTLTVTYFGYPLKLFRMPNSMNASIILSGIIGPVVQAVFAERVRRFSGRLYIPVLCWVLSLLRFVGTTLLGSEAITMTSNIQFEDEWAWLIQSVLAVGMVTDAIVAGSLCYYLRKRQRQSAFRKTQRLVDLLSLWSIETGLLTSILALAVLVSFVALRRSFIWISLYCLVSRCFSNSLLATLNGRKKLRVAADGLVTSSSEPGAGSRRTQYAQYALPQGGAIEIAVETTQETGYDLNYDMKPASYIKSKEQEAFERAHPVDFLPRLPAAGSPV